VGVLNKLNNNEAVMQLDLTDYDPDGPDWTPLIHPRWLAWRNVKRGDKLIKMPLSVNGGAGSSTDPQTWGTRAQAQRRGEDGLGFALGYVADEGEYICGIDLDGCLNGTGDVTSDLAREIIQRFDKHYAEVSPSGHGVHLLFTVMPEDVQALGLDKKARHTIKPGAGGHDEIALDVDRRYYTVTGDYYEGRRTIRRMTRAELEWLLSLAKPAETGYTRDETESGEGYRFFMRYYRKHGDDEEGALRAIKAKKDRAGDWARRTDQRQHERAWEDAVNTVDNPPEKKKTLVVVRGDQVEPKKITWLWPNFFAVGKIGMISGPPDKGKSTLALDLGARVTCGAQWPDGTHAPQGDVIVLTAEDDVEDTALPRFIAAEGDRTKVHFVNMTKDSQGKLGMFSLKDDLELLQAQIDKTPGVKLIIIDPASAYLGIGKVDTFRQTDTRGVFAPVAELAKRNELTVLLVYHFNKNVRMLDALNRISDSVALGALARHVYCTLEDEDGYLFLPAKNNLVSRGKRRGFRYTTESKTIAGNIQTSRIDWKEEIDQTANEALAEAHEQRAEKLDTAIEVLRTFLAKGPRRGDEVKEEAARRNISERTLKRAAQRLGIDKQREFSKPSIWRLP
jgi:putative DNA primase/helicase